MAHPFSILFATGVFPPAIGGPATIVKVLADNFSRSQHQVRVLTYNTAGRPPHTAYPVVRTWLTLPQPFALIWIFMLTCVYAARTDVVFAADTYTHGLAAALAARILRKPFILRFTGDSAWEKAYQSGKTTTDPLGYQYTNKSISEHIASILRTFILQSATRIITDSEYTKKLACALGIAQSRIVRIYNPTPRVPAVHEKTVAAFSHAYGIGAYAILTMARLVPWKGIDTLIRIMPAIRQTMPHAQLVIAGDGPEYAKLQRLIRAQHANEYCIMTGALSGMDKHAAFAASRVFVLNSAYEGMSNTLLEARTHGLAIVASDAGGNQEIVTSADGVCVPYNDADALTRAIVTQLNNSTKTPSTHTDMDEKTYATHVSNVIIDSI